MKTTKFHVWPSAGKGKKLQKAKEHAAAILASGEAIEQLVTLLAAGHIPAPDVTGSARRNIRYAPYFSIGRGASEQNTVPYTAKWIESVLIENGKQSPWIRVALQLLEGRERGYCSQDTFDNITNLRPGYSSTQLSRRLKMKQKEWETFHSGEIALGGDPQ